MRRGKNLCLALAFASIAFHLAGWIVVRKSDALTPLEPVALSAGQTLEDVQVPSAEEIQAARRWRTVTESGLTLAGFVGRASILVIGAVYALSLLISLTNRLGAAAPLAAATMWSLASLAMVIPWVWMGAGAVRQGPSTMFDLADLDRPEAGGFVGVLRFAVGPLLVAALLLTSQVFYRRGYRRITDRPARRLPIHEV
jgi:hypothetical protein